MVEECTSAWKTLRNLERRIVMSEFYNKDSVELEWGAMLSAARSYFEPRERKKHAYHQCLVLSTADGETAVCSGAADSVDALKSQELSDIERSAEHYRDCAIRKIVCMWEGETVDAPSSDFMKKLCEVNVENRNAVVLLSAGADAYTAKKIADMIRI